MNQNSSYQPYRPLHHTSAVVNALVRDSKASTPAFFDGYNNTYAHLKTEQITDILAFLNQYPDNPEAQEFAMAAMETLSNNPNLSFTDIPIVQVPEQTTDTDIVDMLECFDLNQAATLTIYVEQPLSGSSVTSYNRDVGHTFISIKQGFNTAVFGFYPQGDWVNPFAPEDPSELINNEEHGYDVSITTSISPDQLTDIIDYSINYPTVYNLNTYNCTDFGIEIGNIGGLALPNADGTWIGGGGSNPGVLGEVIRDLPSSSNYSTNTTGGKAPKNHKDC